MPNFAAMGWNAFWTAVGNAVVGYAINTVTAKIFGPKQKNMSPTYSVGSLQTQTNSNMVMPIIYGRVKCAGNNLWQSGEGQTVQRLVGFGIGKNKGVYGVLLNDLMAQTGSVLKVQNTKYSDAKVQINGGILTLYSNSQSKTITLVDIATISKLVEEIKKHDGWTITNVVHCSNKPSEIQTLAQTACYLSSVSLTVPGLPGCSYTAYMGDGEQLIDDRVHTGEEVDVPVYEYYTPVPNGLVVGNTFQTETGGESTAFITWTVVNDGGVLKGRRQTGTKKAPKELTQADRAKIVGGLKYDAYIALTIKAGEKLNGSPNITAIWEGRIVRIYSAQPSQGYTLDLKNGYFFKEEWSDNPAWCILDFYMSIDGCGIPSNDMDIQSFINAAGYCDQLVNGQKRFTLNLILDEKKSRQDWLTEMMACCRSYPTYQRGKHGILVDKPEPVSQVFIVKPTEEIEIWPIELGEQLERIIIKYPDPEYEWTMVGAPATVTPPFRQRKPLEKTIEIHGITNFPQASREAWFHLNQAQTCKGWIRYKTNKRALNRSIGDVIGIYDPITQVTEPGLTYKRYRIMAMTEPQGNSIELICREYNPAIYTDQQGSVAPVVNVSKLPNPAQLPPEVVDIQLGQVYYRQKDGTIVSYITGQCTLPDYIHFSEATVEYSEDNGAVWHDGGKVNTDGRFVVNNAKTGTSYLVRIKVRNKMGIVSNGVTSAPIFITGKDNPPSNVASLTATIDQSDSTKVRLSWPAVDDIDLSGYQVSEGSTVIEPCYTGTSFVYTATESRQHTFSVRAVDNSGNPSAVPASKTIFVTIEPAQVAGFSVVVQEADRSKLMLSWQANNERDISYYEIRQGQEWDTAAIIASQLKATSYLHQLTTEGSQTFLVKAFNMAGNGSLTAASKTIQVILRPDAPTGLQSQQEPKDRSLLKISWTASHGKDIAGYELRKGTVWETGEYIDFTRETSYRYSLAASGSFNIMVRAKTVAGYFSNVANQPVTAMIDAYDVTGLTAVQSMSDRTKIRLMWDKPLSLDVAYYEIRKGASWDAGTVVDSRVTGTFYDTTITTEGEHNFWIKAVTIAGKYSQNPAKISGVFSLRPTPVRNITITQEPNDKSIVNISWEATPESDLACYEIRVGYTWETATKIGETKELRWTYRPLQTGDIKVIIKSKNAAEFYSDEAFEHYYATLEPLDVTGFQVIQNGEFVEFYWDKHPEADVVAYEIREGASFELGTLVDSGITLNSHKVKVDSERNYRYHIKAINRSNRYSQGAASQSIFVSNLPPKNVILEYDEISRANGAHNNTEFGPSLINFSNIGGRWSDYPTTRFSDVGGQTVLKLKKRPNACTIDSESGSINSDASSKTISWSTDYAYYGTKSLKIVYGAGSKNVYCQSFDTTTAVEWTVSFVVRRGDGGVVSNLGVYLYSANGGNTLINNPVITPLESGWYLVTASKTQATAGKVNLIGLYNLIQDTTYYIDGWKVEPGLTYNSFGSYYSSGQYNCQAIDIGQVITANITNQFVSTVNLRGSGSAKLQIRTSRDGQQWSEWQDFRPAQYTFRYLDRRVLLAAEDATKTPEVNQFVTKIDVLDVEQTGTVTVPVGGASFLYPKQYYTTPVLTPMALGENRFPQITAKTKTGFSAKIVDRAGNDVGGQLDWRSRGY